MDEKRYQQSEKMLARACDLIPLGSQTFSKSKTQYPFGVSPYFITHGKGSTVWDVDGNEYTDFVNGLLSVSLGYCDPDVDQAVSEQMKQGVSFSLAHPIEIDVAEKIVDMVPCAEMVRFAKNGSDATAGAVRVARAYTGRDLVAVCGYHGWQDWYIGSTTRDLGVPEATKALTKKFQYNNIDSLKALFDEYEGQIAAVILEPMNVAYPEDQFLEKVRELTTKQGAVLIFDETITGFRFANGGAQELFGVTPDLCTMGKGIANGYPLSVVAGKKELMKVMEDIFFSFTFGGETLSLAAANAVIDKIRTEPVVETIAAMGDKLKTKVDQLIQSKQLSDMLSIAGHPCWSFLLFSDSSRYSSWQLKTLWMQEILKRGILSCGTHNMSYAHRDQEVDKLVAVYDTVFDLIKEANDQQNLEQLLAVDSLKPLFSVR